MDKVIAKPIVEGNFLNILNPWSTADFIQGIIAVVAILALVLTIWQYCPKKPEVYGKIISLNLSPSQTFTYFDIDYQSKTLEGYGYNLKTSFTVLRNDLIIKSFDMFVKYPNDKQKYLAHTFRANEYTHNFNGKKMQLIVPANHELIYINSLERGKINPYYVSFIVEKPKSNDPKAAGFEEIEFRFHDYSNRIYDVTFYWKDIDAKKMLFEKEVWKEVEP